MSVKNLAKNTSFFIAGSAMQKALSFIYFIFVARIIGVEGTGKYSFALSFTSIFAMLLDIGMTQAIIRETAQKKDASNYLANILSLKLIGSAVIYGVIVVIINLMGYPELTRQMVYISGFVMLLDSFSLTIYGVIRGHQNLKFESIGVVLNQLIVLTVGLIVLYNGANLLWLISVYLVGSLFNFLFSISVLKFKFKIPVKLRLDKTTIINILQLAAPFAIAGIFSRIYSSMDMILLSKLSTDRSVGIYGVAYKITFALQFVATSFSASLYPAFSHYFVSSKELLARHFEKSIYYLMLMSMPIAAGLIVIADKVIGPVFSEQYVDAIKPLILLLISLVFVFICFPIGALLNAGKKQTRNTINLGIIAAANIILNLILIPKFDYIGSAMANLFSYILLFILGITTAAKIIHINYRFLLISFIKILLASFFMAMFVLYLKELWHFALVIPVGAIAYIMLLILIKGISIQETKEIIFGKILKKT